MHLIINHAGDQGLTLGIQDLDISCGGNLAGYLLDTTITDQQVGGKDGIFVKQGGVF